MEHSGQGKCQGSEVAVFEVVDRLAYGPLEKKWRTDAIYLKLPFKANRTPFFQYQTSTTFGAQRREKPGQVVTARAA